MDSIGFTGTREGMSQHQVDQLVSTLIDLVPYAVRHGGCIGSDEQFHKIVLDTLTSVKIFIHPSNLENTQGNCIGGIRMGEYNPLTRNRHIVDLSDIIIAAPKSNKEELRSGTWATIRYARKRNKRIIILER